MNTKWNLFDAIYHLWMQSVEANATITYMCNDCTPSVWLGLRATVWRERIL